MPDTPTFHDAVLEIADEYFVDPDLWPKPEPEPVRKSEHFLNDDSPLWMWRRWPDGGK